MTTKTDQRQSPGEAYIDAVYGLGQVICQGDIRLTQIAQEVVRGVLTEEEGLAESLERKADLINTFTQRFLRGGLN